LSELLAVEKKAADLLSRRGHFSGELRQKLLVKGFEQNQVDTVISDFIKRGYLNDSDRAVFFIEELQNKRYGKYQITMRLIERGLGSSVAKNAVEDNLDSKKELSNIEHLVKQRKFNVKSKEGVYKAFGFLRRRGFESSDIFKVVKEAKGLTDET
jgi:regulatory protein